MLITNIVTTLYITEEANNVISMTAIMNIGELNYLIAKIAAISRQFDLSYNTGINDIYTVEEFQSFINQVQIQQQNLLIDYNSWSFCKSSNIIKENIIPYATFDNPSVMKYTNLYDFIGQFIKNVIFIQSESFVAQFINKTYDYDQYLFFIIFNSMGEPYIKVLNAYNDIKYCELGKLNDLNRLEIDLFLIEIAVLFCGFFSLAIYLFIIDKYLNLIWEILRTRIKNWFFQLKKNIEDRISQIHENNDYIKNDVNTNALKNKKALNYRHSLRTIVRFSIIFIIALCFTFIQYFIFEEELQISLKYHSILISSVMNRKMLVSRLEFFVLENELENSKSSLSASFLFYNGLESPQNSINDIYNQIIRNVKGMENPAIKSLLSIPTQHYIYTSFPSNYTFLATGSLHALLYYLYESLYFSSNNNEDSFVDHYQYFVEANAFSNALITTSTMLKTDIINLINSKLNSLYFVSAGFGAIFLIIYFCCYYPMLSFDIIFLKKLTDLILIIPKTNNAVHSASVNI